MVGTAIQGIASGLKTGVIAKSNQAQESAFAFIPCPVQCLQESEAIITIKALQHQVDGSITAETQAPGEIIALAHVVADIACLAVGENLFGLHGQIGFQATTGNQAAITAVRGNQHHGAGFPVTGTLDRNHSAQHQGIGLPMRVEKFQ